MRFTRGWLTSSSDPGVAKSSSRRRFGTPRACNLLEERPPFSRGGDASRADSSGCEIVNVGSGDGNGVNGEVSPPSVGEKSEGIASWGVGGLAASYLAWSSLRIPLTFCSLALAL